MLWGKAIADTDHRRTQKLHQWPSDQDELGIAAANASAFEGQDDQETSYGCGGPVDTE